MNQPFSENVVFKGTAGARRLQNTGDGTPSSRLKLLQASWTPLTSGILLVTFLFPMIGSGQARDQQTLARDLEEVARVATTMIDGDVC